MVSRRAFIFSVITFSGTIIYAKSFKEGVKTVFHEEVQTLAAVLNCMHGNPKGLPTLMQLNALEYIIGLKSDPYIEVRDKNYLIHGLTWVNEESISLKQRPFYSITMKEQHEMLKHISEYGWGDTWLWTLQTYVMESMFGDPVYGVNTNKVGWEFINHATGLPRPIIPYGKNSV